MMNIKMLEIAIGIATKAHFGQTDRGGSPYILHCLRVMMAGETIDEKICGVLHDLVEDTNWDLFDVKRVGFSDRIVDALDDLTKIPYEKYTDYAIRIVKNPLAINVKINDLKDNLDIKRLKKIKASDVDKINLYISLYNNLIMLKHK